MDASAGARILYFEVLKASKDRLEPAVFELPASVGDLFEIAKTLYLEASMLMALQSASTKNREVAEILHEFERLIFVGLDEPDRPKYAAHVCEALAELRHLFSEEDPDWREGGFATRWLAQVGIVRFVSPDQLSPFSCSILTDYWTNMPIIMHKTILRLVDPALVEE